MYEALLEKLNIIKKLNTEDSDLNKTSNRSLSN